MIRPDRGAPVIGIQESTMFILTVGDSNDDDLISRWHLRTYPDGLAVLMRVPLSAANIDDMVLMMLQLEDKLTGEL